MKTIKPIPKAPAEVLKNFGITTQHEWRKLKRRELRELRAAAWKFLTGATFTPSACEDHAYIGEILRQIDALRNAACVKNWGR